MKKVILVSLASQIIWMAIASSPCYTATSYKTQHELLSKKNVDSPIFCEEDCWNNKKCVGYVLQQNESGILCGFLGPATAAYNTCSRPVVVYQKCVATAGTVKVTSPAGGTLIYVQTGQSVSELNKVPAHWEFAQVAGINVRAGCSLTLTLDSGETVETVNDSDSWLPKTINNLKGLEDAHGLC